MTKQTLAITADKSKNFPAWYKQLMIKARILDYGDVSGCYILLPKSYFMWESVQKFMNSKIAPLGVENCYFPMFVSRSHLFKEKAHIEGFSPEVAWITRCGSEDLAEPIAIRPTSETVMYPAYAKWVRSHQDLPIRYNQWNNVTRWEFKTPTPFIRSREILWQEGHCAHATHEEALDEVKFKILKIYEDTYKHVLAVYVIKGEKTEEERFPGADHTFTIEAFIEKAGKGVQAATAHYLGMNFSKMFNISFSDENKAQKLVHQNCWGYSTRALGVVLMQHSDNKGAVIPPRAANLQIVIIPILKNKELTKEINDYSKNVLTELKKEFRVKLDDRVNVTPGFKYNEYELQGVCLRIEIGSNEFKNKSVRFCLRHNNNKKDVNFDEDLVKRVNEEFEKMHEDLYRESKESTERNIEEGKDWKEFMGIMKKKKMALMHTCNERKCEQEIGDRSGSSNKDGKEELVGSAKTLCIPRDMQDRFEAGRKCFGCGKEAKMVILYGRTY